MKSRCIALLSPCVSGTHVSDHRRPTPQITEYKEGSNVTVSRMEITPAKQKDAGFYECEADNKYAVDRRGFRTDFIIQME